MRKEWKYKEIGCCFPYIRNGANIKQLKNAEGYPITRIETLSGGIFNRDRMGYANIFDLSKYKEYILENGDLLMSHINSKAYIGRTVEYSAQDNERFIHGMNLLRLKSNANVIISAFFEYYTNSQQFKVDIARIRKDAVNQSSFAISDLKKIIIPLPSLSEQQLIVAELDKIKELITLKRSQYNNFEALSHSIFYEMFGDPIENEKGWVTEVIGKVAPCVSYKGEIVTKEGKYWLLNLDMVESMTGRVIEKKYVEKSEIGNSTFTFNEDNVLYSKLRPYLNKVVIPKGNGFCTSELLPLCPDKKHLSRIFLAFVLRNKSFVDYINIKVAGAKMPRVSMTDFRNFRLILPPMPLQLTFAERISAIEQEKLQISSTIKTLETLLASRMQYWFE